MIYIPFFSEGYFRSVLEEQPFHQFDRPLFASPHETLQSHRKPFNGIKARQMAANCDKNSH